MSFDNGDGGFREFERQKRHRRGKKAESLVAVFYMLSGHKIIGRRFKTPAGEIDIIAYKKNRVAFVEVKRRPTNEDAESSITPTLRRRVRRAADLWLAKNPKYQSCEIGFDLVFVLPWRVPIVMRDSL